jgi:hypothetical protein
MAASFLFTSHYVTINSDQLKNHNYKQIYLHPTM